MRDMTGAACECGGHFKEAPTQDDTQSVLHCSNCDSQIGRWEDSEEGTPFLSTHVLQSLMGVVFFGFLGSILLLMAVF